MKSVIKKARHINKDTSSLAQKSLPREARFAFDQTVTEDLSETFKTRRLDPLTENLGCTSYYHKMRWHWLSENICGVRYPLEVSRYYHDIKLAIDIGADAKVKTDIKKHLMQENGIEYVCLESANDFEALFKARAAQA